MNRARVHAACALLLLGASSCSDDSRCEEACRLAEECGFLPSDLGRRTLGGGSHEQNCVARCRASKESQNDIASCLPHALASWCGPAAACRGAAECLADTVSPSGLGRGGLLIDLTRAATPESCFQGQADSYPEAAACSDFEHDVSMIAIATNASSRRPSAPIPCDLARSGLIRIQDIPAGLTSLTLEVTTIAPDSDEAACIVLDGGEVVVRADTTATAPGPLLRSTIDDLDFAAWPRRCESSQASCSNGLDDDLDGLLDCLDLDCEVFCAERPPFCTDGRDNDGNGVRDCDESACAFEPFCLSESGETDTG